jgi:hypothetical protein
MTNCFQAGGAVLAAALILTSCGERPDVFYAHAIEARAAGAVDQGWIPDWMPKSARAIHEIHDLDTSRSMLTFLFEPVDPPQLPASCGQVPPEGISAPPFRRSWWPDDVPPTSSPGDRHVYYRCSDGAYVAVASKEGRVFHWRP